jgi:hypothetical protein
MLSTIKVSVTAAHIGGSSQGEIAENIFAYECELVELVQ